MMTKRTYRTKNKKKISKAKHKSPSLISRVLSGMFTLALTGAMVYGLQSYSSSDLSFVQVSDVHFSTRNVNTSFKLTADSPRILDDVVEQINETPNLNFVMFTGDLIDRPFEKELNAVLPHIEKIQYPWYFVFGNHDPCIGGFLTKKVYMDILKAHNENFNFDKPYYSFSPRKGYKVIGLDTIITSRLTSNGEISREELGWLDNELKNSKNDIVLIFMHIPIIEPFPSAGHRLLNADEVQAVIEKYKNPIAVFQGHYHANKITQHNNILYVNSPSLVSYPNAFRIINIKNERKKVIFDIRQKETRLSNIRSLSKIMVMNASIYTGDDKDQSAVYEINKK